ncbi:hypothetical protein QO239_03265 [Cupriavidus taiwanensis]|uniref:hypothetical protein n=1 Tax=Cupriavidus taiwanensis TaxID=164546 RepID=UPI001572AC3E|nr:hypothetical protein [Cupriavidus taiwanensis]MDK3021624.1 hypothetical protein [Cupriavidus taiwanensis]NSX17887.1 hypothetical protein [Cupriavidus taiwanensis]
MKSIAGKGTPLGPQRDTESFIQINIRFDISGVLALDTSPVPAQACGLRRILFLIWNLA